MTRLLPFLLAAVLVCGPTARADSPDATELEKQLDVLAGQIADALKSRKADQVKVGEVACPTRKNDPHAAWLQQDLTARLTRRKVTVTQTANYELTIEYGFTMSAKDKVEELYILAKLRKDGVPERELPRIGRIASTDLRDKLRMASACVSLDQAAFGEKRDAQRVAAEKEPKAHLSGDLKTRVSAVPDSPYYLELLVGPKGGKDDQFRERKATIKNGLALAQIDKDEEYRIRIANNSKVEQACRVYIDGIDLFELSDDRLPSGDPKYRHILVPAGKAVVVPGWHRSAAGRVNWNAFVVTEFGKGVASMVNPKGPIGNIKVVFADSFELASEVVRGRAASMETARGRDLEGKQEVMVRKIEKPHECIVVRYTRGIE